MEREIIRRIIIERQEFVNEIPLIERPFFFEITHESGIVIEVIPVWKWLLS